MSFRFQSSLLQSPSTPIAKNSSFASHPSTTPAGPPPSYLSHPSTTPAGLPPRSAFGSSYIPASTNTFGAKSFAVPDSSPPKPPPQEPEEDERHQGGEDDEQSMFSSPRGLKRSRDGQIREQQQQHDSDFPAIARGIANHAGRAKLNDPDDVILLSEEIIARTDRASQDKRTHLDAAVHESAAQLARLWKGKSNQDTKEGGIGPVSDEAFDKASYITSLLLQLHHPHTYDAPSDQQSQGSSKLASSTRTRTPSACFVPRALLNWLDAHHTPFPDDYNAILTYQPAPSNHERFWDIVYASLARGKVKRVVRLLKDGGWEFAATAADDNLPEGYSDYQIENIEIAVERCVRILEASPAVQYDDWDVKGAEWMAYRLRVRRAIDDLEQFAGEDERGSADTGTGAQRSRGNMFHMSARSGHQGDLSLSAASQRAESKVPWSIYENLKLVYGQLLGNADELIDISQDWLEASIFLTVWWDGEGDIAGDNTLLRSSLRKSLNARLQKTREVDISPLVAYRRRLAESFALVVGSESVFTVDTSDAVQVALVCAVEDSVESVIAILRMWSLPLTAAIVEIAALGGWLPQVGPLRSRELREQGFNEEDLMVLSHGPSDAQSRRQGEVERDELLAEYAELLSERKMFRSSDMKTEREGWELAIAVLGRRDDGAGSRRRIEEIMDRIDLADETRVDKVLAVCYRQEMVELGRGIAERYADSLADVETPPYGSALIFYARAHATVKLKNTLALLTSLCLLQSAADPAMSALDAQLASLLSTDRAALTALARTDAEAAALLASHLSGYATLRRFFDLRDQTTSTAVRPLERKREAATCLIVVLESAADCIRGGLFDASVEAVIPVDGVLALLGEALPLLSQAKRIFTREQVWVLLRVVEDFATAPTSVRQNAESLLSASLKACRGEKDGKAMRDLLKKSRSDLSAGSGSGSTGLSGSSYDMMAESVMLRSVTTAGSGSGSGGTRTASTASASVVQIKRAWDWRSGLEGVGGSEVGGKEVLMLVRLALAKEVARGWGGQIKW